MAQDPRANASGRSGSPQQNEVASPKEKATPKPDTSYDQLTPDVAANAVKRAYAEAQSVNEQLPIDQRDDIRFTAEKPSLYNNFTSVGSNAVNQLTGSGPTAPLFSIFANFFHPDTEAASQRDPYLRANYLPGTYTKQNAEIAIARLVGHDPSLVRHPHLLFNSAIKDMKAHDVQRLATYADLANAYNALLANPDGFQNAAKTQLDRLGQTQYAQTLAPYGKALDIAGKAVSAAAHPVFDFFKRSRAMSDAVAGKALGVEGDVVTDEKGNTTFQPKPNQSGPGALAFEGLKTIGEVPGAVGKAVDWAFDVQRTMRTLHDIKATQGDQAYYSALAAVVGTTAVLTFATDGLGILLRKLESSALRKVLVEAGVDIEGTGLLELRKLAYEATTPAKHLRYIKAVNNWIKKLPPAEQGPIVRALAEDGLAASRPATIAEDIAGNVNAYTRAEGIGLTREEQLRLFPEEAPMPSAAGVADEAPIIPPEESVAGTNIFNTIGEVGIRGAKPILKGVSKVAGLGWKYPKVPMNFQLGSQLLFGTGAFGAAPEWKESWDRTYNGETYVDPQTKRPVSLGRDIAGTAFEPDSFWYNAVSGPLDLLTTFAFDPTMAVLKPLSEMRQLPPLLNRGDVNAFFATNKNAKAMAHRIVSENTKADEAMKTEVERLFRLQRATKGPDVREWRQLMTSLKSKGVPEAIMRRLGSHGHFSQEELERIARAINPDVDSYATLARVFEPLTKSVKLEGQEVPDIIGKLTSAKSYDEVVDIFGDLADAQALLDPRRLASYGAFTTFKDFLYSANREQLLDPSEFKIVRAAEKVQAQLARGMTSIKPIFFPELGAFSNQIGKIGDPATLGILRRALLAGGRRPDTVELVINRLARSGSPEEFNAVYKNFIQDTFKADAEMFVDSLVQHGNFNKFEGAVLRNALLKPFQAVIDSISQTLGGGGLQNKFTGTAANQTANRLHPFEGNYPTFGLVENHEHYFALPDYKAWDNFKQATLKGLSSKNPNSLRANIMAEADRLAGKNFDDAITNEMRLLKDWNRKAASAQSRLDRYAKGSAEWLNAESDLLNAQTQIAKINQKVANIAIEREAHVKSVLGDFEFYKDLGKLRNKANVGIHQFHETVRHWLIDQFFRQLALATGSFSMRVGSSEAIASVFRLGAKEYTKNWLASNVAKGVAEAMKTQERKVVVPEDERNVISQIIYDILQSVNRAKNETLAGVAKGLDLDKMVQRLAKDIYARNGQLWGIGASHHQIDDYKTFHNLASGHGTGDWEYTNVVDNDYLAGLTKALNDRSHSRLAKTVAEILNRNLDPKYLATLSFDQRVMAAKEEATRALESLVKSDPTAFTNLARLNGDWINRETLERLMDEVKTELGVTEIKSMQARNMLAIKLRNVNAFGEYANALVEDLLWLSHGRGRDVAGQDLFASKNAGDKVFHREILDRIASGRMPTDPNEIRELYLHPTTEQARTAYRMGQRNKGMEPMSYHSALYEPGFDPADLSTLTPEERKHFGIPEFIASPNEARTINDWYPSELRQFISESTRAKPAERINKFAGPRKGTLSRIYGDAVSSRFPANVPMQKPIQPSSLLESLSRTLVNKPASWVHDTISTPIINGISRTPLYATEFNRQMDYLEPLVQNGTLPEEVAMNVARQRAIEHAIKYVHNPQDRYVLEQWARGFAPFWFAKNQALRRAGRLALEDPARFEQYVRAMLVMQSYGANSVRNGEENSAVLLPGSIMGGRLMTHFLHAAGMAPSGGVPIGLTGSMGSLASVFPWTDPTGMNTGNVVSMAESVRPDFGPMVSLPMRFIALGNPYNKDIQELNDLALGHIGSRSSLFQQMVPNSLVRSLISLGTSTFGTRNSVTNSIDSLQAGLISQALDDRHRQLYASATKIAEKDYESNYAGDDNPPDKDRWVDTIANAYVNEGIYQNGKLIQQPISYYIVDPTERQHLIDSTHQAALSLYAGRTALSFFSPLALSTTQVNPEMMKLIRDVQKTGGDFSKAEKLFEQYPEAIYYALHRTASETGVSLPATLDMAKFQMDNSDLFSKGGLSSGLIAFVPYTNEGDKFDSHEYHSQLQAGLRRQLTPDEFMKNMARVVGNNYAYNYLPKMIENVFNGNSTILRQAKARYAQSNPLWAKTQGDTGKSRMAALEQVRRILEMPDLNQRTGFKKTAPLVREIVRKYDEYSLRSKFADPGFHDYVEKQWESWLDEYVKAHPEVSIGVNSIFQGLKLRDNR